MKERLVAACAIVACVAMLMQSCQQEDSMAGGKVPVSFDLLVNDGAPKGGRILQTETPVNVQVTVEDDQGTVVLDNEVIELIPFGSSFASDPVELVPGNYVVTSFLVLNEGDTAIYAAPLEGTPSAQLVDDPLTIPFTVIVNEVTSVPIEVLIIDDVAPSEFGYASFIPVLVPTFKFEIVVFEKDTTSNVFNTTTAHLLVTSGVDTIRQDSLIAGINLIEVNDSLPDYTLRATKTGFEPFDSTFTITDLKLHSQASGNTPLEVILVPGDITGGPITSGTFVQTTQDLSTMNGQGVTLGDLDGDGDIDAFLASDRVAVWFNDGTGNFSNNGQIVSGGTAIDVALGDFDGDSDLDVFIANSGSTSDRVWFNDGSGTFTDSGQALGLSTTFDAEAGDLDGDGDIDVFASSLMNIGRGWINDGSGTFTGTAFIGGEKTVGVELADIDDDSDLDVIAATQNNISSSINQIWLNDGSANFTNSGIDLGNENYFDVSVLDANTDGLLDILFTGKEIDFVSVFVNTGGGIFIENRTATNDPVNSAIGDLNNDGHDDFALGSSAPFTFFAFLNDGNASFTGAGPTFINQFPADVEIADLNGDTILDVIMVSAFNGSRIFFGQP